MPSRRQDSNIEDLAAIAQLYQSLNGGQQRAQDAHQQNALGILGLMMQQQGQEDNLDFKKSAAEQENNRFLASQTQANADAGMKYQIEQDRMKEEGKRGQNTIDSELLRQMLPDPNIPVDQKQALVKGINPERYGPIIDSMHQAGVTSAAQKAYPAFAAPYTAYNTDHNYGHLQAALAGLQGSGISPEVFNAQPWDTLNAGMTPGPTKSGPTDSLYSTQGREGGILGAGGILGKVGHFLKHNWLEMSDTPEEEALKRKKMEEDPINPMNLLFGKKVKH